MQRNVHTMWKFGSGAGLAPMAGVTDVSFRLLCHELGAAWAVSEMLSAKGFLYAPKSSRAVRELLLRAPQEGIVGLQLFGHEPELMAEAANQLSSEGFAFIDINMGCPAQKIVSGGEGSALMKTPELAGRIVRAVVSATKLPVTVKIRSGWDERCVNAVEMARILEDNGASALTVHGRTRMQFYAGRADWQVIKAVKHAVSIPVFGNGDIASGADALRMLAQTQCDAVMVGRAAQGNPWIFAEIGCALRGESYEKPCIEKRVYMALRHLDMMEALRGEKSAMLEMRKHIAWYLQGSHGCVRMRRYINELNAARDVRRALLAYAAEPT